MLFHEVFREIIIHKNSEHHLNFLRWCILKNLKPIIIWIYLSYPSVRLILTKYLEGAYLHGMPIRAFLFLWILLSDFFYLFPQIR